MSGNGQEPAATPAPRRLVLEFPADGSVNVTIQPEGELTPAHIYLAAWTLDAWAREVRAATVAAQPRLEVARPGLVGHLPPGGLGRRT